MDDDATVFECGNVRCKNTIAITELNVVQLKGIRRSVKTCADCGKQTRWLEQIPLINIAQTKKNGVKNYAKAKSDPNYRTH